MTDGHDPMASGADPQAVQPLAGSPKVRGVADVVFLMDVTGSMQPCIDALHNQIQVFIAEMAMGGANQAIQDWRVACWGFRDIEVNESNWIVKKPFVRSPEEARQQLTSPAMRAKEGGDAAETPLDALYLLSQLGEDPNSPDKWRPKGTAHRWVVLFSDARAKNVVHAKVTGTVDATVQDLLNQLDNERIKLALIVPHEDEVYQQLAEYAAIVKFVCPDESDERRWSEHMRNLSSDDQKFKELLQLLGRTVSQPVAAKPL